MCLQKQLACLSPSCIISTLWSWPDHFRVCCPVLLTIHGPIGYQFCTAGMLTWCIRSSRHTYLLMIGRERPPPIGSGPVQKREIYKSTWLRLQAGGTDAGLAPAAQQCINYDSVYCRSFPAVNAKLDRIQKCKKICKSSIGSRGRIRTFDLKVMGLANFQLLYPATYFFLYNYNILWVIVMTIITIMIKHKQIL